MSGKPNTTGLLAHAQKKAQETHQRVSGTIDRMLDRQQSVNFSTVARTAGVTKAYLYNQPDLRECIDAIRVLQGEERLLRLAAERQERSRTERSNVARLAAKDHRTRELEAENQRLREEIKKLHGKFYETI